MKSFIFATFLFSLAAAAAPTALQNKYAKAYIRLITTQNAHYAPAPGQQFSPSSGGITIQVLVGQTLNFNNAPPFAQEVVLERLVSGRDVQGVEVRRDDERVVCRAMVGISSQGVEVRVKDTKMVNGGRGAKITGLFCEMR